MRTVAAVSMNKSPKAKDLYKNGELTVSVIIPVRNDAERLDVCLHSVFRQVLVRGQIEVIVVDNGSTDSSCQVAQKYDARTLQHPKLRVGALRNRGVESATGELLAFVDSDHEVPENWVQAAVHELLNDESIKMIGSPCLAPSDGTWVQRCWQHHRLRCRKRRAVRWLGAGNMFLWKKDFDAVGRFREDLTASEDVDLSVRVGRLGAIICDMRVANTHYGEPRTLLEFARKEFWRGASGVAAYVGHGMPLHEARSMLWPLYHLFILCVILLLSVRMLMGHSATLPIVSVLLLLTPSCILALKVCAQVRRLGDVLPLTILYLVYGITRGLALFMR